VSNQERDALRRLWASLVEEFRASGLGQAAWCRQHGYKVRQLQYWLRKFRATDAAASEAPTWLPVPVAPSTDFPESLVVRVGAAAIDIRPGFNPDLLRAVVRTLA
jgi:transposase-like protein